MTVSNMSPALDRSSASTSSAVSPEAISIVFERESRRVFATLVRLLGDFDLAEDALQDAFTAALLQWPNDGFPDNPRAWLVSTGRFKAIDAIRRRSRFDASLGLIAEQFETVTEDDYALDPGDEIVDDRLRLIFTCCHPALAAEARVALTLREVCGLTTEEIARAFLVPAPTLAQRIVRAKNKIKQAGIPYLVPGPNELPERLESVLQVIYLVFNEGYAPSTGQSLTRTDLSTEAIRLGRLLCQLLPDPEVKGLLALMLLHDARREARTTPDGDLVLLADQDRTTWNRAFIEEGVGLVEEGWQDGVVGPYLIQAAIAAVHSQAERPEATDWQQIVLLYDLLLAAQPSAVIELNRAVAVAMRDGPEAGLTLIDAILERGDLTEYTLAHSARADLARRAGDMDTSREAYLRARALTVLEPEVRFLDRRLAELDEATAAVAGNS